jgi:hypothetical protein
MTQCYRIIAATGAIALLAAGAGFATDIIYTYDWDGYANGPLVGQIDPYTGAPWEKESTSDQADMVIDPAVFSPMSGSGKSLRWDHTGAAAPNESARLGIDLATAFTSGYVLLQYDYTLSIYAGGNQTMRVSVLNRAGVTDASPAATADLIWQPYMQNGGGTGAAQNGFFGINNAGTNGVYVFQGANHYPTQFFPIAGVPYNTWARVKFWFDLNDATYPGRMVLAQQFDITCGQEKLICERHVSLESAALTPINGNSFIVRAFQLRGTGPSDGTSQSMWYDNVIIRQDSSFVLPTPTNDPPPTAKPADRPPVDLTVSPAFGFGGAFISDAPSMTIQGRNLYTFDPNNGLFRWDVFAQPASATFVTNNADLAPESEVTGILAGDATDDKLYLLAGNLADPTDDPNTPNRDLNIYDVSSGTWSYIYNDANEPFMSDHSVSLLTVEGQKRVYSAYLGAQWYDSTNPDGTVGPRIADVGNRWAGATTEGFTEYQTGDLMYILRETDASGNPINDHAQVYQAIYYTQWIGCNGIALPRRLSPSAQILPWQCANPDGPGVNRHQMEYIPCKNELWVMQAADTNVIGVYDIDTDTWGLVNILDPNSAPVNMLHADMELVGRDMLFMIEGRDVVYKVPVLDCPGDVDGDNVVTNPDLQAILDAWSSVAPDERYNGCADFNGDGRIENVDLQEILDHWADTCP